MIRILVIPIGVLRGRLIVPITESIECAWNKISDVSKMVFWFKSIHTVKYESWKWNFGLISIEWDWVSHRFTKFNLSKATLRNSSYRFRVAYFHSIDIQWSISSPRSTYSFCQCVIQWITIWREHVVMAKHLCIIYSCLRNRITDYQFRCSIVQNWVYKIERWIKKLHVKMPAQKSEAKLSKPQPFYSDGVY